jgi:hypothetical protein
MLDYLLIGAVLYCIFSPPRWDLAIRWKEYNIEWARRLEEKKDAR